MQKNSDQNPISPRPPVVVILGHVDHGKTTLLDYIRRSEVAKSEHGGITQSIGAYQVDLKTQNSKRSSQPVEKITFIDTPGHEAFSKMRSRGAHVADIAVLVVSADDSVKPQTKESITEIKRANIPLIVAVNKTDLPSANIDRVKQDLAKEGIQVEHFGGDVPLVPISAKTGAGVQDLLEMIALVSEMLTLENDDHSPVEAVVIETRLDKGKGIVASVIVKRGILRSGNVMFEHSTSVGKVRAMLDEHGVIVAAAEPGKPVEVSGFTRLASVGAILHDVPEATIAPSRVPPDSSVTPPPLMSLPDFLKPVNEQEKQKLSIILKADTAGSLEAITNALGDRIRVVGTGVGDITEADILQAKSSAAFVVGFAVKASSSVDKLAKTEKVIFRIYTIIYELLEELSDVVSGMKEVVSGERELGESRVIAEFPYEGMRIAGVKVLSGRIARGDLVKVMRADAEIGRGKIKTIRIEKEDVSRVSAGKECGILFDRKLDFDRNDAIIAISTV